MSYEMDFEHALEIGRPPNIQKLFPDSRAFIISGKVINRAMIMKGDAVAVAANGRNSAVIRGVLLAAQKANAAAIIEIAKSESTYCGVNFWNIASIVDNICNDLDITIPVAIHADHYTIKNPDDLKKAKNEIPIMFNNGITSIAIDASHMTDADNLLACLELAQFVPPWAGFEVEVGEIKGKEGLSTVDEALFLIKGLNAHGVFPDWIALNNGTTHGIEASSGGIQVDLTTEIHKAIELYGVMGAQHGTSGNSFERLRDIAKQTNTTKANVATALMMISWGVEVNDYGNAVVDGDGNFIKRVDRGVCDDVWARMATYAEEKGWSGGNYKKLCLPFEVELLNQQQSVCERMSNGVKEFTYLLMKDVLNTIDTAPLAVETVLNAGSYDLGFSGERTENPTDWTLDKITEKAMKLSSKATLCGDFDD